MTPDLALSTLGGTARRLRPIADDLAAVLAAPARPNASEQHRSLAVGMTAHLIHAADALLAINLGAAAARRAWPVIALSGWPGGSLLAWPILLRIEEYLWRTRIDADDRIAAAEGDPPAPLLSERVDAATLSLAIADQARVDAYGMPILPLSDLSPDVRRAVVSAAAAARYSLSTGDGPAPFRAARDAVLHDLTAGDGIEGAAARFRAALPTPQDRRAALSDALLRGAWPQVAALLGSDTRPYAAAMTMLARGDEPTLRAALHWAGADAAMLESALDRLDPDGDREVDPSGDEPAPITIDAWVARLDGVRGAA